MMDQISGEEEEMDAENEQEGDITLQRIPEPCQCSVRLDIPGPVTSCHREAYWEIVDELGWHLRRSAVCDLHIQEIVDLLDGDDSFFTPALQEIALRKGKDDTSTSGDANTRTEAPDTGAPL